MSDILNELRNETDEQREIAIANARDWADAMDICSADSVYDELPSETRELVDEGVGLLLSTIDGGCDGTELVTRLRILLSNLAARAVNIYAG